MAFPTPKLSSVGRLLVAGAAVLNITSFGQVVSDLADLRLKANASLAQHSPPGVLIAEQLANAHTIASSKGIPWKGLNIVASDHEGVSPGDMTTVLLQLYRKQACQADAILIGHTSSSAYHLSAFGTGIYSDHILAIDRLLKDNGASPLRSHPNIVVTRPGGSLLLSEEPITLEVGTFPPLQVGITYLQFLRHIPQSSSYQALDPFSTLVADGNDWKIARTSFSGVAIPGFTRGALELTIADWLKSCK